MNRPVPPYAKGSLYIIIAMLLCTSLYSAYEIYEQVDVSYNLLYCITSLFTSAVMLYKLQQS